MSEAVAFRVREHDRPAVVRVNFGVFAGRQATPAEIDELARKVRECVESFAIIAEERHEFAGDVEASLRQVVIEVPGDVADADSCDRIVELAERWAAGCIRERSELGELGSEI